MSVPTIAVELTPDSSPLVKKSPNIGSATRTVPARMPCLDIGSVTCRKVADGAARRGRATPRGSGVSNRASDAYSGMMKYGIQP